MLEMGSFGRQDWDLSLAQLARRPVKPKSSETAASLDSILWKPRIA
jgi:hypothetical protein